VPTWFSAPAMLGALDLEAVLPGVGPVKASLVEFLSCRTRIAASGRGSATSCTAVTCDQVFLAECTLIERSNYTCNVPTN